MALIYNFRCLYRTLRNALDELNAMGKPIDDGAAAVTLLSSLPKSWDFIIISLESRIDKLSYEDVVARLMEENSRRKDPGPQSSEGAFISKSTRPQKSKNRVTCNHCKRQGHTEDDCWKKQGLYDEMIEKKKEEKEWKEGAEQ